MSAQSNIARPYAHALFELAQEQNNLAGWNEQLQLLALVASDKTIINATCNPAISSAQLVQLTMDVCADAGGQLNERGENLVKLLVRNKRVNAIADIAEAYAARKAEAEEIVAADMITATAMDASQQQQFTETLRTTLGRNVNLAFAVDEELIGGAVIRAGDWVVDGSVKAQLEQLAGTLGA